jgi:hypothetical protein
VFAFNAGVAIVGLRGFTGAHRYFIPLPSSGEDEMQRLERSENQNTSAVQTATLSHFDSTRIARDQTSSHRKTTSALRGCGERYRGKTSTLWA